jgi:Transmembrane secretion effector
MSQGFRSIFAAAAVSTIGTQISFLAAPLLTATDLNATPAQVGILGVLKTIAFLLVGLPVGARLDRIRRRGACLTILALGPGSRPACKRRAGLAVSHRPEGGSSCTSQTTFLERPRHLTWRSGWL